jgi:hypothetical protein
MLDNLEDLKRRVEDLKRRRDQSRGARQEVERRLKEQFGVKTIEEARRKLKTLERKRVEAAEEYARDAEDFEKELDKREDKS